MSARNPSVRGATLAMLLAAASRAFAAEEPHQHHEHHPPAATEEPQEQQRAPSRHVPPAPPTTSMPPMSNEEMIEVMGMDDTARYGIVSFDELEWRADHVDTLAWSLDAIYGGDFNKLGLRIEGEYAGGTVEEFSAEALWIRPVSAWWSLQAGLRVDDGSYSSHEGPTRSWATVGLSGLAPYRIEVDAMLYAGESGRTALRIDLDYDLLITQRWILRPHAELHFYGEDDPERDIGSGLADVELGLRLHYEIRRELAPYVGMLWSRRVGETEDRTSARGADPRELQFVAGLHVWF
jgi:copper resistance protein B